ncbi:MAG: N-acyl homoserine lactonase family protein [Bdellovibrio sp.]|nr:N-acyl homoserine lactonase family protein [Methylotenera sp.]
MTSVTKFWPILTATHRYDKSISTFNRGAGQMIEAPILAYLIETKNGRILYDVGCDYRKINNPAQREKYYNPALGFGAPVMDESQRLPNQLAKMGLSVKDVDVIFLGHLHFDHAGGLCDCGDVEVHIQVDELANANTDDIAYFDDEILKQANWQLKQGEYDLVPGVRAIATPGHTAGHMSLWIELPSGAPIILAGDAADLTENIIDEVAPGNCWQDQTEMAVASIRKLKRLAQAEKANLWPNHDMAFWRTLKQFPEFHS